MMNDNELALNCMQEERDEFEARVFEILFGANARPPETIGEYMMDAKRDWPSRIFSYEDAQKGLAEVSKSLQLLHMIKEHFDTSEEEDTEENWQMRELIDRLSEEGV